MVRSPLVAQSSGPLGGGRILKFGGLNGRLLRRVPLWVKKVIKTRNTQRAVSSGKAKKF